MHALTWRKSSRSSSAGDQCVELARLEASIAIRDSKDPHWPIFVVSRRVLREAMRSVDER
ncbi:DUF397 domain-containing protein [Actinomadura sp. KC06]|uniref:DUF397 domain-containing protein n=1 Tax=Actinomadura sp. KC06 TaxID=2530369 RepID=UPI001FB66064|nr:DUF397 domain-containing protein [Actinomadura sp. KC06]